jgi:iron complex outermembrane receptor protein
MKRAALLAGSCMVLVGQLSLPAHAQDVDAAARTPQSGGIGDIVVTARRVEESLQTTPVSVTAFGGEALTRQRITDLVDIQRGAPGFVVRAGVPGLGTLAFVAIRGQGNFSSSLSNDPSVGIYLDGVYIPRPMKGIANMRDLQRAEVLRGPQGTLFGRNTTGGALNIISKDPVNNFEGEVNAEVGNFGQHVLGAILNVPLADNLAVRLVYNFQEADGFGKNPFLDREVQDERTHLVRAKLKYDGNGFDINVSGDYSKYNDKGAIGTLTAFNPDFASFGALGYIPALSNSLHSKRQWWTTYAGGAVPPAANPLFATLPADVKALHSAKPMNDMDTYGFAATVNVELGELNLKSITGYRYMNSETIVDSDGTPAPVLLTYGGEKSKMFSEELQLSGDITDQLSFITGGYYGKETGYDFSRSQIFGGLLRNSFGTSENISKGVFAQAYYQLTDSLRFAGGFRYTWDTRNIVYKNRQIFGLASDFPVASTPTGFNCVNTEVQFASPADRPALAATCLESKSAKFSYPAWTAGVDWQATDDIFLYAKTSGAARAGGWNFRAGVFPAFKPEKVVDVEGGFKATLLDRKLRTNIAVFHSWRKQIQAFVQAVVPGIGSTSFVQNNGDARIWGAEFEIIAAPWDGMEINVGLSLLDGKYDTSSYTESRRIANTDVVPPAGCTRATPAAVDCVVDLSGTRLPQLPKKQFNIGFTQTVPVDNGEFALHFDYAYIDKQTYFATVAHPAESAAAKNLADIANRIGVLPGYGTFNARVSYRIDDPNVELYVFARNLTNQKYIAGRYADLYQGLGFAQEQPGAPRFWGGGVTWKFSGT